MAAGKADGAVGELDRVLATLVAGLRVVTVLLWPYLPSSAERLLRRCSGSARCSRRSGARWGRSAGGSKLESLFPKAAKVQPPALE